MPSMIVCEVLGRQRELAHDRRQRAARPDAAACPSNARAISWRHHASLVRATPGSRHFVDDVVDLAAERVERGDRAAPRRRQEQEAVVEARAALRGLLLAVLVGRHAAAALRARTTSASRTRRRTSRASRSTGRRANTSPPTASMRVEDAQAALRSPRTARARGATAARARAAARRRAARARAPSRTPSARASASSARCAAICASSTPKRAQVFLRQVDAVLPPVDRDVLPEVGELQARADRRRSRAGWPASPRRTARAAGGRPGWPSAGSSRAGRRRSRSASTVTSCRNADTRSWKGASGSACCADRGGQRGERRRVGRLAALDRVERARRTRRARRARSRRRRVAFVGQVVRRAREPVDRDDRGPQPRRHEPRRDGKVFVMADGHVKSGRSAGKGQAIGRRARPRRTPADRCGSGQFRLY